MDTNHFSLRNQILFISYQDIIKQTYPIMLMNVIKDYYDELNYMLKLDEIKDYDLPNLQRLCIERTDKNPLIYLLRDKTNETHIEMCDKLLEVFEDSFIDMYTLTNFTDFGSKLFTIEMQPFIKEIFIYSERPIYQIVYDSQVYFKNSDKIKYVAGDFIDVINQLHDKPTSYILNDVMYIQKLIDNDLISYTEIMVSESGYNFELTDKFDIVLKGGFETLMKEKIFKLGFVKSIELTNEHFSKLDEFNK